VAGTGPVAVGTIKDDTQALPSDALGRLTERLRTRMSQVGGFTVVAAQAPPETLRYIANAVLNVSLGQGDGRFVLTAALPDAATGTVLARGAAVFDLPSDYPLEARVDAALNDLVEQL